MTGQGRAVTVRSMRTTAPAIAARAPRERAGRHYVLDGRTAVAPPLRAGLYLVATPIGNLGDITVRALEVLAAVDLIACEDTRVTRKLLDRYGIATPLTSYHEHNAAQARPKLLARIADGAAIALVSDAGTPLVSDPGYKLVREARAAGANLKELPGAAVGVAAPPGTRLAADRDARRGQGLARLCVKDAGAESAAVSGAPRREVYRRGIALSKERGHAR